MFSRHNEMLDLCCSPALWWSQDQSCCRSKRVRAGRVAGCVVSCFLCWRLWWLFLLLLFFIFLCCSSVSRCMWSPFFGSIQREKKNIFTLARSGRNFQPKIVYLGDVNNFLYKTEIKCSSLQLRFWCPSEILFRRAFYFRVVQEIVYITKRNFFLEFCILFWWRQDLRKEEKNHFHTFPGPPLNPGNEIGSTESKEMSWDVAKLEQCEGQAPTGSIPHSLPNRFLSPAQHSHQPK